jgi:hypothetical protein
VCIFAFRASERDSVAAAGRGFIVPPFDAALVATFVLVMAMTRSADGAGGVVLLA